MSEKFINGMTQESNVTYTLNGMKAVKSTLDDVLDLFATVGALRNRTDEEIVQKVLKAFAQDPLLTLKTLFYARDIRGGLGERRTFKVALKELAIGHSEYIALNMPLIPEYGRWDDLFVLFDTPLEKAMKLFISFQLHEDIENLKAGNTVSLLAKWMPSTGPLAKRFIEFLHYTPKVYRKTLSALRGKLDLVERKMSAKEWNQIVYEAVPSKAMLKYRKAFDRRDESRFAEYLQDVSSGKKEIKASTLYPYDLIGNYNLYNGRGLDHVIEEQWRALPNYVEGNHNILVMADVSGSMSGRPMHTSVGLAMYFAERNSGPYHNKFLTFSAHPELVTIKGDTLRDKIINVMGADWNMNTNLMAAMRLVLKVAVDNKLSSDELPKALVIISDMEFDSCASINTTLFAAVTQEFEQHGYTLPKMVFWNVNSIKDTFHALSNDVGVFFVSGQSVSSFKGLLAHLEGSPVDFMLKVLGDARYNAISIEHEDKSPDVLKY